CKSGPDAAATATTPKAPTVTEAKPPVAASAQAPAAKPPAALTTVEGVSEYQLENGLSGLLVPDDSQARIAIAVVYHDSSRHEGYGETGMAHLLEHMMFKGSPEHPKVWEELREKGALNNASTDYDRTEYHESLPATDANVDWALEMEADRMIHSNIAAEDLAK